MPLDPGAFNRYVRQHAEDLNTELQQKWQGVLDRLYDAHAHQEVSVVEDHLSHEIRRAGLQIDDKSVVRAYAQAISDGNRVRFIR
jgi:hypothetical protein